MQAFIFICKIKQTVKTICVIFFNVKNMAASKGVINIARANVDGEMELEAYSEIPSNHQKDFLREFLNVPYSGQWENKKIMLPPYSESKWYGNSVFDNYVPLKPNQRRLYGSAKTAFESLMGNGRKFGANRENPDFIKKISTLTDEFGYKVYCTSYHNGKWIFETPFGSTRQIYTLTNPINYVAEPVFLKSDLY